MGEHLPCKQGVRGSNPLISSKRDGKEERGSFGLSFREAASPRVLHGLIAQLVRARA